MASSQRTPPRFVPTLTTVLEVQPAPVLAPATEAAAPDAGPVPSAVAAADASQAVTDASQAVTEVVAEAVALTPQAKQSEAGTFRLEEQLLHRVLQRVDLSLEERVSDAVSAAVQHHLDSMIPGLRAEIEAVVRTLVSEALAQELLENPVSVPPFGPQSLG